MHRVTSNPLLHPPPPLIGLKATAVQRRAGQTQLALQMTPPRLPDTLLCLLHPKTPFAVTFVLIRMSQASVGPLPSRAQVKLNYDSTVNDDGGWNRGGSNSWLQTDTSWTYYSQGRIGLTLWLCFKENVKRSLVLTFSGLGLLGAGGEVEDWPQLLSKIFFPKVRKVSAHRQHFKRVDGWICQHYDGQRAVSVADLSFIYTPENIHLVFIEII